MAKSKHVRMFLNVASARLGDAKHLLKIKRTVAAAYLSGYAVECWLKALILSLFHEHEQRQIIERFRGSKAHDYRWLQAQYQACGGGAFPKSIISAFAILSNWNSQLRYNPREEFDGDIEAFFEAVETVRDWALKRI